MLNHQRLAEAFAFAATAHAAQVRKGTAIPYVAHVMSVSALVLEHGGDEDQAIAGLLHDVIEDCGIAFEPIIRERFGERVAGIVRACTDADTQPKPPWQERKETYLRHLEQEGPEVLLVSACDKLHNARAIVSDQHAIGMAVFERFSASRDQVLWYYRSLAEIYDDRMPGRLADEVARTVGIMQGLARGDNDPKQAFGQGAATVS
jgi:(p)ppGpp synthase/HD superfamily hydrolase